METRANYALIGLFTLAVIASAFGFVLWFSGNDQSSGRKTFRVVFTTSVSGLSRGSNVLFNGVRVGEVSRIDLGDDPGTVSAIIDVDQRTPVKINTRARLEYQGFTGVASVALSGGSADSPELPSVPPVISNIVADRSDYQNIVESLQNLAAKTDGILTKADRLIGNNEGALTETVENVRTFTRALAANSDGFNDLMAGMADLGRSIRPLSERLTKLTDDVDRLVLAVDPAQVRGIVANVDAFTTSLAHDKEALDALLGDAARAARQLADSTGRLDTILTGAGDLVTSAGQIVGAVDPRKVASTLDDINWFAATLDQNREATTAIFANAQQLVGKLNASADKVDDVLKSAQGFLGQPGSKGMFEDVAGAAQSIRKLADNLDKRTRDITEGINKFTGPGLRDYQALAADGKRTLDEINRTVRSLQRNPQQVIFGAKPEIPEYTGR